MAKKPTLADVARRAGVSVYTVSRALSDSPGVSVAAREKVGSAARELGYVRNRAAQELRKNSRSTVTVVTASTSNAYYIDMMTGVQRVLRAAGRTAVVADVAADGVYLPEVEDATVETVIQSRTAGVISTLALSPHNLRLLEQWDVPIVFVDSSPPADIPGAGAVTTDNVAASHAVGDHLAQHGFREWLLIAYPRRWTTRAPREAGLRESAERHGARLTVIECENDPDSAAKALAGFLERGDGSGTRRPDVVVAGNNPLLQGCLRTLREQSLQVPADVAVVAFDEFPWAPLLDPPMTVLNEDSESIGQTAAEILMRLIDEQVLADQEGRPARPRYRPDDRREVTAELVVRGSCGC